MKQSKLLFKRAKIIARVKKLQKQGKRVVFTNGCYDILHAGHIRFLTAARKLGEVLVVALNSDKSVHEIKGPLRPLVPQAERAEMLAALECVDFVTIFNESEPYKIIKALLPNVLVKGGDWAPDKIIGADVVKASGGKVKTIRYVKGKSTTNVIKKVLENYGGKKNKADL